MSLLSASEEMIYNAYKETGLEALFSKKNFQNREEIIYRKNGTSVDKVIEFDAKTGTKIKTTHYDFFDESKIRSIDEYDVKTGKKVRTTNYVLYKSVDEYDIETGKKLRTINYNVKDETKISSIQEYDLETGKIVTISIYKKDGETVSIVKKIDPVTDEITSYINKEAYAKPVIPQTEETVSYDNIKDVKKPKHETISGLIDNLYKDKKKLNDIKRTFNL